MDWDRVEGEFMGNTEDGGAFNRYVNKLRAERGYSMKQVCEGLCTSQEGFFLERKMRTPGKLLQNAIMERLGVEAEDYEHFLNYEEYERWKARQDILHGITFGDMNGVCRLLEEYHAGYVRQGNGTRGVRKGNAVEQKLEMQFYLGMLAQVRRHHGASREELWGIFEKAVHLTVPALEQKSLKELVLSIKELNLILEAEQYREEGGRAGRYREVREYIEEAGLDGRGMAKIYPKAVLFWCRNLMAADGGKGMGTLELAGLLRACNRAVEILRDNSRMYYLWEILGIRERILTWMRERIDCQGTPGKADGLEGIIRENTAWKSCLQQVYGEYGVPKETFEYCYLYVLKGVSCINDCISIRRRMLGMRPGELCDGICDRKTLRRLERRQTVPQGAVVEMLFERLGLPRELTRTELVTDSPEARRLMEKMRWHENARQWEKAEQLLNRIMGQVSLDIRSNRQVLLGKQMLFRWNKGEIGREEYCARMQEILEQTIPMKAFYEKGEKYFTYMEQICLQNMLQGMDRDREEFEVYLERLEDMYFPFLEDELQDAPVGLFEMIMNFVASERGNRGEYDLSDRYSDTILSGCLRFRRLGALHDCLYNRWWNHAERKRRGISLDRNSDDEDELNKCIILSHLNKQENNELLYKAKLERIRKEKHVLSMVHARDMRTK